MSLIFLMSKFTFPWMVQCITWVLIVIIVKAHPNPWDFNYYHDLQIPDHEADDDSSYLVIQAHENYPCQLLSYASSWWSKAVPWVFPLPMCPGAVLMLSLHSLHGSKFPSHDLKPLSSWLSSYYTYTIQYLMALHQKLMNCNPNPHGHQYPFNEFMMHPHHPQWFQSGLGIPFGSVF